MRLVKAFLFAVAVDPSAAWAKAPQAEKIGEAKPKRIAPPPACRELILSASKRL
jgi:hypothetical protein